MYFSNAANNARHALLQRDEDVAESQARWSGPYLATQPQTICGNGRHELGPQPRSNGPRSYE